MLARARDGTTSRRLADGLQLPSAATRTSAPTTETITPATTRPFMNSRLRFRRQENSRVKTLFVRSSDETTATGARDRPIKRNIWAMNTEKLAQKKVRMV